MELMNLQRLSVVICRYKSMHIYESFGVLDLESTLGHSSHLFLTLFLP